MAFDREPEQELALALVPVSSVRVTHRPTGTTHAVVMPNAGPWTLCGHVYAITGPAGAWEPTHAPAGCQACRKAHDLAVDLVATTVGDLDPADYRTIGAAYLLAANTMDVAGPS